MMPFCKRKLWILVVTDYRLNLCRVRCRLFSLAVVSFMVPFCKRKLCFFAEDKYVLNIYNYACENCSTHEICLYDFLLSIKVLLLLLPTSNVSGFLVKY